MKIKITDLQIWRKNFSCVLEIYFNRFETVTNVIDDSRRNDVDAAYLVGEMNKYVATYCIKS